MAYSFMEMVDFVNWAFIKKIEDNLRYFKSEAERKGYAPEFHTELYAGDYWEITPDKLVDEFNKIEDWIQVLDGVLEKRTPYFKKFTWTNYPKRMRYEIERWVDWENNFENVLKQTKPQSGYVFLQVKSKDVNKTYTSPPVPQAGREFLQVQKRGNDTFTDTPKKGYEFLEVYTN